MRPNVSARGPTSGDRGVVISVRPPKGVLEIVNRQSSGVRLSDEDMYRVKLSHRGERPKSDGRVSDSELVTTTNRQIA